MLPSICISIVFRQNNRLPSTHLRTETLPSVVHPYYSMTTSGREARATRSSTTPNPFEHDDAK